MGEHSDACGDLLRSAAKETHMRRTFLILLAASIAMLKVPLSARTGIWTGIISDSSCGASHDAMTEHGTKATDKQCTQMCVLRGAKYVFVNEGRVLMVKNQDLADLKTFAGDRVMVSGDLTGDTITLTKIVAPK